MFDILSFAKILKANLEKNIALEQQFLEEASGVDISRAQGKIQGFRLSVREIQDLLDQLPNEDA